MLEDNAQAKEYPLRGSSITSRDTTEERDMVESTDDVLSNVDPVGMAGARRHVNQHVIAV
jgi:hypothetical protein